MSVQNAIDTDKFQLFLKEIRACNAELDSEWGTYAARCKGIKDRIADWIDRAKDIGVPKRVTKLILKREKLEADLEGIATDLDDDDRDIFDFLLDRLGVLADTPLGQAAAKATQEAYDAVTEEAARKKGGRKKGAPAPGGEAAGAPDALDSLTGDDKDVRPRFMQEAESERVAENRQRLEAGISKLN
jgi:hypothetical protein